MKIIRTLQANIILLEADDRPVTFIDALNIASKRDLIIMDHEEYEKIKAELHDEDELRLQLKAIAREYERKQRIR